jgi:hypothetical protein
MIFSRRYQPVISVLNQRWPNTYVSNLIRLGREAWLKPLALLNLPPGSSPTGSA